jgi:Ca2+/Na+ antiporter
MEKKHEDQDERYSAIAFEWKFPEFEKHDRGKDWYITAGIIAALLLVYAFVSLNFLFVVIILLTAFILYLYHIKEAEEVEFKITDTGLSVENRFYVWSEIKKFYIIYNPPSVKNLYFEFKSFTKPNLIVPMEHQNPLKAREYLLQFLEEDTEKEHEPTAHAIGRHLKI